MLSILRKWPDFVRESVNRDLSVHKSKIEGAKNFLLAGMGGSSIPGQVFKEWLSDSFPLPFDIWRDYGLPYWVNADTCVFCVSYSGNTEETISAFQTALRKTPRIICITSGGKLAQLAKENNIPVILVPPNNPPRTSLPLQFFPLILLMQQAGLIDKKQEIEEVEPVLRAVDQQKVREIALKLKNFPIVYCYSETIAYLFKTALNENSKVLGGWAGFPEMCHNELEGWKLRTLNAPLKTQVIYMRDYHESPRIKQRIEIIKKIINPEDVIEIWAQGEGKLARMFSLIYTGELISAFLAEKLNVDAKDVELISKLKKELARGTSD